MRLPLPFRKGMSRVKCLHCSRPNVECRVGTILLYWVIKHRVHKCPICHILMQKRNVLLFNEASSKVNWFIHNWITIVTIFTHCLFSNICFNSFYASWSNFLWGVIFSMRDSCWIVSIVHSSWFSIHISVLNLLQHLFDFFSYILFSNILIKNYSSHRSNISSWLR